MAHIGIQDAQQWAERTKLSLETLEDGLEQQIATQVLAKIARAFDVSGWTNTSNTPSIVKSVIAMTYVSWLYSKIYSEDQDDSNRYAIRLLSMAEELIEGIASGAIDIADETPAQTVTVGNPSFYPTDGSSALVPTTDDPSLGPAAFTMGQVF